MSSSNLYKVYILDVNFELTFFNDVEKLLNFVNKKFSKTLTKEEFESGLDDSQEENEDCKRFECQDFQVICYSTDNDNPSFLQCRADCSQNYMKVVFEVCDIEGKYVKTTYKNNKVYKTIYTCLIDSNGVEETNMMSFKLYYDIIFE